MPHPIGAQSGCPTTKHQPLLMLLLLLLATMCATGGTSTDGASRSVRETYGHDNSLLVEHSDGGYYRSSQSSSAAAASHGTFGGAMMSERNGTDNRKPAFRDCATLSASVREEQAAGVFVIKVQAIDPDREDRIEYKFVNSATERAKFRIEAKTGNIYTTYQFDRDEPAREKEVSAMG